MALESVPPAETLVQSNEAEDDDLEDGEIPSDEDDEPTPPPKQKSPEPQKIAGKCDGKDKNSDGKSSSKSSSKSTSNNNTKSSSNNNSKQNDRVAKYKNPSDDWAGDVEKAIKAALDKDKDDKSKSKGSSSSRRKDRKRSRDDGKEDDRNKDQKKRRMSDEENGNEDDEEFMFVRGASPTNPREHRDSRDSSPRRRSHERDSFDNRDSDRDSEERSRHDKRNRGSTPRRSSKNERSSKSKNRNSARNDRNSRRNQGNDHNQDPDSICVYFMQGKCHRGDECPFSHNALPPRKMELCKFYITDCCAKRDKCLYMHHDFPCKFYHTGMTCQAGSTCKFSHEPLSDQVKTILLKHLETAPKEILGDFPRVSRENAVMLINKAQRAIAEGRDPSVQKIPSLFDLTLPTPPNQPQNDNNEDNSDHQKRSKDNKKGKKSRWGSDDDRVPLEQIMLLQSVSQLGLNMPALSLAVQQRLQQQLLLQQCIANMELYKDIQGNDSKAKESEKSDEKSSKSETAVKNPKDIDLRQILPNSAPKATVVSLADAAANLSKSSREEESDRDEESTLVIEVPQEEEDKSKEEEEEKNKTTESSEKDNVVPSLPKTAQELFLRIQQQQQQKAESEQKTIQNVLKGQENWYSDDSDNEELGDLQIVIKDDPRDENSEKSDQESPTKEPPAPPILQPAPFVESTKYNKIDISAEVTKLLSSIKPQPVNYLEEANKEIAEKSRSKSPEESSKVEAAMSPKPVSRDPRMSRDPRQRRLEETKPSSPSTTDGKKDTSRPLRLETSIYSSGITDYGVDTDFRARLDQDHRVKDLDLRQRYQDFGDTDLRIPGYDGNTRSDVDLRQMLTLPFKPAPSHVPCTEIEASYASHLPKPYKVHVVDIPRPNYSGLKLTKDDAAVKHDPRLRKIFKLSMDDLPESPMSPPPISKIPDTPKSPPLIRADPRRKALETQIPVNPVNPEIQMNLGATMIPGVGMGLNPMLANPMQHATQIPMGMNSGPQNQMAYGDPRYIQRNGGPGLLGPAPGLGYNEGNYDPGYSGNNFNNYGPNDQMMGFPNNQMGFNKAGGDWSNANPARNRGRLRRRNRNRTNPGGGRTNRSPP